MGCLGLPVPKVGGDIFSSSDLAGRGVRARENQDRLRTVTGAPVSA